MRGLALDPTTGATARTRAACFLAERSATPPDQRPRAALADPAREVAAAFDAMVRSAHRGHLDGDARELLQTAALDTVHRLAR